MLDFKKKEYLKRIPGGKAPPPTAKPQPLPPPPVTKDQTPVLPTTNTPEQQSSTRPARIGPAEPNQQGRASQNAAPGLPSSAPATTEPQSSVQPVSPSREPIQTVATSVPSSPSSANTESQDISQPASPLLKTTRNRATSKTQPASNATSQSRGASVPESAVPIDSKPLSRPRLISQCVDQTSKPSSPSRTEKQVQPKASQLPPPSKKSQSSDSTTDGDGPRLLSKPAKEIKETEEQKEVMEEPKLEGEGKVSRTEDLVTSTLTKILTAASDSTEQAKELLGSAFRSKQRQNAKEDILDEKKIMSINPTEEKTKLTSQSHHRHDTSKREASLHKKIKEDITKFVHKLGSGKTKLPVDQKPVSIVTLAGENRGVFMHLSSEPERKDGYIHITRGYKTNPDESMEATTEAEESSNEKLEDSSTKEDKPTRAFISSNTQGINNSILSQTEIVERNPGVHVVLSHKPAQPTNDITEPEPLDTRKAEFNVTHAEKLTYKPRVRRRCLRGLFLESSDSDPDNPEKPRRHGCRYNCGEKRTDKDKGIF
ncbi:hypothetical protein K2173_027724 [Erythroxylum novogranatense]|uniref:Flocculation protein FLO11-like n=1 Tax=Erythroxylum novogranatense TaxID=1862640 RepID=A0AAV8TZZ4_9ROSI|nr:hypothetical protein K2173_027724 [Erythroxylum novogranatense]